MKKVLGHAYSHADSALEKVNDLLTDEHAKELAAKRHNSKSPHDGLLPQARPFAGTSAAGPPRQPSELQKKANEVRPRSRTHTCGGSSGRTDCGSSRPCQAYRAAQNPKSLAKDDHSRALRYDGRAVHEFLDAGGDVKDLPVLELSRRQARKIGRAHV